MNAATVRILFLSFACVLLGVGLLMVYSASVTARPTEFEQVYLSRHVLFLGVALAAGVAAALLPAAFWRRSAPLLFCASALLLVAVMVPGVGARINGAQRWFRFAGWSMQPSEFTKITLPLFICWWATRREPRQQRAPSPLSRADRCDREQRVIAGEGPGVRGEVPLRFPTPSQHSLDPSPRPSPPIQQYPQSTPFAGERETQHPGRPKRRGFWSRMLILLPIAATVLCIAAEPDLGTAAFLAGVAAIGLFVAGWPIANFTVASLATIPAAAGVALLRPYQLQRITGFLAAWRDIDDAPYQVRQSIITLGGGGTDGVGLGQGWQKLSFLPEANTDFVVAVLGEELGLVGTLGLTALWIGLFLTGLRMLATLPHRSFEYAAGVTLLTQLVLQAALNVAVVTAMVPPKGIAHPLVSYGGSSLVASILTLGIITSLARPAPSPSSILNPQSSDP